MKESTFTKQNFNEKIIVFSLKARLENKIFIIEYNENHLFIFNSIVKISIRV